jgi:hypothetical protein
MTSIILCSNCSSSNMDKLHCFLEVGNGAFDGDAEYSKVVRALHPSNP